MLSIQRVVALTDFIDGLVGVIEKDSSRKTTVEDKCSLISSVFLPLNVLDQAARSITKDSTFYTDEFTRSLENFQIESSTTSEFVSLCERFKRLSPSPMEYSIVRALTIATPGKNCLRSAPTTDSSNSGSCNHQFTIPQQPMRPQTLGFSAKLPLTMTKSIEDMLRPPGMNEDSMILNRPLARDWADGLPVFSFVIYGFASDRGMLSNGFCAHLSALRMTRCKSCLFRVVKISRTKSSASAANIMANLVSQVYEAKAIASTLLPTLRRSFPRDAIINRCLTRRFSPI
ncbi:hypothetical protein OSTOST_10342 [Ostertagia ostertagi]